MKCKKCSSENIIKYGLRRGKPCFLCNDCEHQFTSEKLKFNVFDKYIAVELNRKYSCFIVSRSRQYPLRITDIAKLLGHNYTTVNYWIQHSKEKIATPSKVEMIEYLNGHKNGFEIIYLLYLSESAKQKIDQAKLSKLSVVVNKFYRS